MTFILRVLRLFLQPFLMCLSWIRKAYFGQILPRLIFAWRRVRQIGFTAIGTKSALPVENSLPKKKPVIGYKNDQLRWRRLAKASYQLKPGWVWNPLLRFPRNSLCFCGSGIKSKKCCLPKVPLSCKVKEADSMRTICQNAMRA